MKYTAKMFYKKSTPGTHVYFGKDFSGLYIPKKCFQGELAPDALTLTIEGDSSHPAVIDESKNGEPREI